MVKMSMLLLLMMMMVMIHMIKVIVFIKSAECKSRGMAIVIKCCAKMLNCSWFQLIHFLSKPLTLVELLINIQ